MLTMPGQLTNIFFSFLILSFFVSVCVCVFFSFYPILRIRNLFHYKNVEFQFDVYRHNGMQLKSFSVTLISSDSVVLLLLLLFPLLQSVRFCFSFISLISTANDSSRLKLTKFFCHSFFHGIR